MALPLLGLLASQGARAIATRIAGSAATRRKVAEILSKNFKQAQKESLSKGKIPSESRLIKNLNDNQKGLLSDILPGGLKGRVPSGGAFKSSIPSKAEMEAAKKAAKYTFKGPVPDAAGRAAAEAAKENARIQSGRRASQSLQKLINDRMKARQAAYGRSPITQTADAGLTTRQTLGLLGGATAVPLIGGGIGSFVNQETPQVAATEVPMGQTGPQAPRFMQVINPGYDSTGKEVLNAALLRAGLRMAGGGNLRQALDAAASVADSRNIFKTGEEALAAGRRNLGEAADIGIKQNADGTYSYSGALEGDPVAQMDNLVNSAQRKQTKGQPKIITKQVLEIAMRANPSKTEEEVISELEKVGFTNPEG